MSSPLSSWSDQDSTSSDSEAAAAVALSSDTDMSVTHSSPAGHNARAHILVDKNHHEQPYLQGLQTEYGEEVVSQADLPLGDIVFVCGERRLFIERKKWADWQSGLSDGRYKEQKGRYFKEKDEGILGTDSKFIYLMVGQVQRMKTRDNKRDPAVAAEVVTQVRDGIPAIHALDFHDTLDKLIYLFDKFKNNLLSDVLRGGRQTIVGNNSAKKKRKRDHVKSQEDIRRKVLSEVTGMSVERADAILATYPTFPQITKAGVDNLKTIKVSIQGKGARAIGSDVCKNVIDAIEALTSDTAGRP